MSARIHEQACSSCAAPTGSTLACLGCGALLDESADSHHYARLGLSPLQVVDEDTLEAAYLKLSRRLHPDHQPAGDADAQRRAIRNSALLNEAYETLRDEQTRHEYLLELFHPGSLDKHKTLDPEFLMEAMEVDEELEQARIDGCADTVGRIAGMARAAIAERMAGVTFACRDTMERIANAHAGDDDALPADIGGVPRPLAARWNTEEIATLLHQARVYRRILRDTQQARPGSTTP